MLNALKANNSASRLVEVRFQGHSSDSSSSLQMCVDHSHYLSQVHDTSAPSMTATPKGLLLPFSNTKERCLISSRSLRQLPPKKLDSLSRSSDQTQLESTPARPSCSFFNPRALRGRTLTLALQNRTPLQKGEGNCWS